MPNADVRLQRVFRVKLADAHEVLSLSGTPVFESLPFAVVIGSSEPGFVELVTCQTVLNRSMDQPEIAAMGVSSLRTSACHHADSKRVGSMDPLEESQSEDLVCVDAVDPMAPKQDCSTAQEMGVGALSVLPETRAPHRCRTWPAGNSGRPPFRKCGGTNRES